MKEDQSKSPVMNIVTGIVVVGLLVAGYFILFKKDTATISPTSVALVAQKTSSLGVDIDSTIQSLKNLSRAVENATIIFDLPAFRNLQDFSVPVTTDGIGRINPFTPADWKIKLNEAEGGTESVSKPGPAVIVTPPVSSPVVAPVSIVVPTPDMVSPPSPDPTI